MRNLLLSLSMVAGLHGTAQQDTASYIFRSLSEALQQPTLVKRLDLSGQALERFPTEVLLFPNLEELRLRQDGISKLPPEIGQLKRLRLLDLSGNPIVTLPIEFTQLEALEELYLNDDPTLDLEGDLQLLSKLPRLRILHLEGDGIERLPGCIVELRRLEELYLTNNALRDFPQEVIGMRSLKLIDLRTNPLKPLIPLDLQQQGVLVRF
ncbi:MAG: leucine-rich repeat domain-containing protein [Flavobacteriales bacterium]